MWCVSRSGFFSSILLSTLLCCSFPGCRDIQEREQAKSLPSSIESVRFDQGRALIQGQETFLAGIVYHPVPVCMDADYDFTADRQIIARDLPLLEGLNVNPEQQLVLRLVRGAKVGFMDQLWQRGIMIIPGLDVSHKQDFTNPRTCDRIKEGFRSLVSSHQNHPAVFGYELGAEVALLLKNSGVVDLEAQLVAWFRCLNEAAGIAAEVEGPDHRPVATVSVAADDDPLGDPRFGADDASLDNLQFHMISIYRNTTVKEWLRGPQRAKTAMPIFFAGFGADACRFEGGECVEDQEIQARYVVSVTRDLGSAFADQDPLHRALGGSGFEFTDEWWKGGRDACSQEAGGYREDAYPDGFLNEEWMGMIKISEGGDLSPRAAYHQLSDIWARSNRWSGGEAQIAITSHQQRDEVEHVGYLWGSFSGLPEHASLTLIIEPEDGSGLGYLQHPLSLHYGAGPESWVMLAYFGEDPRGARGVTFKVVPAFTETQEGYDQLSRRIEADEPLDMANPPSWLTLLSADAVTLQGR